jgi:hypothetical protein
MNKNEELFRKLWFILSDPEVYTTMDEYVSIVDLKVRIASELGICKGNAQSQAACTACTEADKRFVNSVLATKWDGDQNEPCSFCPLNWGVKYKKDKKCPCERKGTLYNRWRFVLTNKKRAELAKKISKMEWK